VLKVATRIGAHQLDSIGGNIIFIISYTTILLYKRCFNVRLLTLYTTLLYLLSRIFILFLKYNNLTFSSASHLSDG
jgi:hypothetical protein